MVDLVEKVYHIDRVICYRSGDIAVGLKFGYTSARSARGPQLPRPPPLPRPLPENGKLHRLQGADT